MLSNRVSTATGQLSPGIWLGEFTDDVSSRIPDGKYGGGQARADFLQLVDKHSVRSIDIWTSHGKNRTSCPSPRPSTSTRQRAYDELRAWKTGQLSLCDCSSLCSLLYSLHTAHLAQPGLALFLCLAVRQRCVRLLLLFLLLLGFCLWFLHRVLRICLSRGGG